MPSCRIFYSLSRVFVGVTGTGSIRWVITAAAADFYVSLDCDHGDMEYLIFPQKEKQREERNWGKERVTIDRWERVRTYICI